MSSLNCLEAPVIMEETQSPEAILKACRTIRESWSAEERARRQRLAEQKQVGLLLRSVGLAEYLRAAG